MTDTSLEKRQHKATRPPTSKLKIEVNDQVFGVDDQTISNRRHFH